MAFYDCKVNEIIHFDSEPWPYYPGWIRADCGCSNGLQWGGEEPRECSGCKGMGFIAIHEKTKRVAMWPGGPFLGSMGKNENL